MSMYNITVNAVIYCPNCGETIRDFFTKDYHLEAKIIDPIGIDYFYCACLDCGSSFEFKKESASITQARRSPFTLRELTQLGFKLSQK